MLQTTLYHAKMGREPRTAFTALIEGDDEGFQFSPIDENKLLVVSLVDTQEEILAGVLQRVDTDRRHHRAHGSRSTTLPHFTVGDYVLVARVSKQDKHSKLMSTWTGPCRVTNDDEEHVYAVQHLVTVELRDVHVARIAVLRRCPARDRRRAPQGFPAIWKTRASTTSGASRPSSGLQAAVEFVVKVAWEGLEDVESTWEPVSRVFHDAPAVLRKELKALRPKAEQNRALVQRYGLRS